MRSLLVLLAVTWISTGAPAALAGLDHQTLTQAGFHILPGRVLPLSARVSDRGEGTTLGQVLKGKPALMLFVDYRCRSLCGVMLDELESVLPGIALKLGQAYDVITVALDGRQTQDDAKAFIDQHLPGMGLRTKGHFLTEKPDSLAAIEASVGLVAPFDDEHGQFAHPAALIVVDANGEPRQVLSALALNPLDLTLALSGGAAHASLGTSLLHLCYGWDAVVGRYTLRIERILAVIAAMTIVLLFSGIGFLLLLERRRRSTLRV